METGHSKWRKLDNAASAFPAATGKRDTRVFRFYCKLKEAVDGNILQSALDQTIRKYPLYQAVLRKGLFWFYLEQREIAPVVKREDRPPCSKLYIPDKKSLLFEVTYEGERINFEVFHALTDGTGAMEFLQELVRAYLKLAHPEMEFPEIERDTEVTDSDQEEDSFSQYYSDDFPKTGEKKEKAARIPGMKVPQDEMRISEIILPVDQVLKQARQRGVSITVLMTAVLLSAISEELPRSQSRKPVSLMVPVNLRNYFPSNSMANFFGWIEVGYHFKENTTFDEVLIEVKRQFETQLVKERIGRRMSQLVQLEKHPVLRAVPLEIKQWFLMAGTTLGGRTITAVYSNIGVIRMEPEYESYIDRFGIFTSTGSLQLCSCSFGNQLVLGLTSKYKSTNIQRNCLKILKEQELPYREEKEDFPGYNTDLRRNGKKAFQAFSFICILVAMMAMMVNFCISRDISWSGVAAAGCLCTWILAAVGYKKRRNLLKNSMWQLLIVTALGLIWDYYTGWHGWSVDFVLPISNIAVFAFIAVLAKFYRLEEVEYLFYLVQASVFGLIPWILLVVGVVHIPYPSVICGGIGCLSLIWLFLFRGEALLQEIHKKFRL